jgi:hypothetical protein
MVTAAGDLQAARRNPGAIILWACVFLVFAASRLAVAADSFALQRGDIIVTGFSGIKPGAVSIPPGGDPLQQFFIDTAKPALRILRLAPGAQPDGKLSNASTVFKVSAGDIGQVFAATLDNAETPDIYVGATSAFGLNIVVPDSNGDGWPERKRSGDPKAIWMPGQFGTGKEGGPGSIWKVDGRTGSVSLFATLPDNNGPGIGDIVFDKESKSFFVSDLDTGLIYRLEESGKVTASFDHGSAGRPAAGLAPVADDGKTTDIKSASFSTENPDSWGLTQPERRAWGLAIHDQRLYYAVWGGSEIWSVGLTADGSFGADAKKEFSVAPDPVSLPISDMVFDDAGSLYLAQRGSIQSSWDYSVFAFAGDARVLRFRREGEAWVATPEEYAIGLRPNYRAAAGGVALGQGPVSGGSCDWVWATGNDLLAAGGTPSEGPSRRDDAVVNGVRGSKTADVRPANIPPTASATARRSTSSSRTCVLNRCQRHASCETRPASFLPPAAATRMPNSPTTTPRQPLRSRRADARRLLHPTRQTSRLKRPPSGVVRLAHPASRSANS